ISSYKRTRPPEPTPFSRPCRSALYESEKLGIDHVGVCRTHAVWEPLVDLESPLPQQFRGERRGISDRDDLVVVAMHDERRHVDLLQIFGKVRLREGLDAVVVCFRAAHHGLTPPVLDHSLQRLRAGRVVAVEGTAREFPIELRPVGGELLPEAVKYLDRQAARVGRRFSMIGGMAPISTNLATRPLPWS